MGARSVEITTERLLLRPIREDDAADVLAYASDPNVAAFTSWRNHESIDDARAYVRACVAAQSDEIGSIHHVWGILIGGDGPVVGTIDLVQTSPTEARIDYALAARHWSRGYMTEAVRALASWAFTHLPALEQLRSGCLAVNVGSVRVLEKAGFELVHRRIRHDTIKPEHDGFEGLRFILPRP